MPKNSQNNLNITEPEISNVGVNSSEAMAQGRSGNASPEELRYALDSCLDIIDKQSKELEKLKNGSNSIEGLAKLLADAIKPQPTVVPNQENINRTIDFRNAKNTVDGRSLMEAQQTLQMFRNERKYMISVPKSMANAVGSSLSVTVNGVRICIPCDGKAYPINETHYEHIRERLAKLDILAANTTPNIVEIN